MSERKESSVLFSLRELQTIEEERVSEERTAAIQAADAEKAAKNAAQQAVRDEEDARRTAAENAERSARDQAEQQRREEQLRLEETERRARVEAQAQVEQHRMVKEMELRHIEAKRKKPAWIIAAIGVAILVGGLVIFFQMQASDRAKAEKERIAIAKEVKDLQKQAAAAQVAIDDSQRKINKAFDDLEAAKTEEAKAQARQDRKDAQAEMKANRAKKQAILDRAKAVASRKAKAKKKRDKDTVDRCAKSNDPLCGL